LSSLRSGPIKASGRSSAKKSFASGTSTRLTTPLYVEEEIIQRPNDQGGDLKGAELRFNRDCLRAITRQPIAIKLRAALPAGKQGLQIKTNNLIRQDTRVGIGSRETRAECGRIVEQCLIKSRQCPLTRLLDVGQNRLRGPIVVRIAIREGERA
jgi:hypothetical protein